MRKAIVLLTAVSLLATITTPCIAEIIITAVDAGNGQLRIGYTATEGEQPAGFGLTVDIPGSYIEGSQDLVSYASEFNMFEASHPFAHPSQFGAVDFPASYFSVSMGSFFDPGTSIPESVSDLITIQLHSDIPEFVQVTIGPDTLRTAPANGVVGMGGVILDVTMPEPFQIYVPEPATLLFFGLGGLVVRKRRKAR